MKREKFNEDWQVLKKGGMFGMPQNSKPRKVKLPFDAMFYEQRRADAPLLAASYPGGVWEYRKTFFLPEEFASKKVIFQFDGVYERSLVYLNGDCAASQACGYSQFFVDAGRYLKFGSENEIRVVVHIADSARWYSGAGIYRDVWMLTAELLHIEPHGVRITTPDISTDEATVHVATALRNDSAAAKIIAQVVTDILDDGGAVVASDKAPITVFRGQQAVLHQKLYVESPKLWDTESPVLYTCRTKLLSEADVVLDESSEPFGIRSLRLSPKSGFSLNGRSLKLRGACLHHENGPIGAVSMDFVEKRRISLLKKAGFNAIRTAHNPPSRALLRACDELGVLVLEEAFDTWTVSKVDFDHTLDFQACWEDDLESMVSEAFNHPSVIIYSIGNEIADTGTPNGSARGRQIAAKVRALDPTRFTLNSINGMVSVMKILEKMFADSQAKVEQEGQGAINSMMGGLGDLMKQVMMMDVVTQATAESFACVDIGGYNYMDSRYEMDRALFPNRLICGTETFIPDIAQTWRKVLDNDRVIGDFAWTGWDYVGEPGTGLVKYGQASIESGIGNPYPCFVSMVGEFSINGFRRPASYFHEIVLGLRKEPYIAVQRPQHYHDTSITTPWSWSDSVGSWSWQGFEGQPVRVEVYSDAQEVELLLNGNSIGKKPAGEANSFRAVFETVYQPGELIAVAYGKDGEKGRFTLRTAEGKTLLTAAAEKEHVGPDDMIYVPIALADAAGSIFTTCQTRVKITVDGPGELLGFGTDDPSTTENFFDAERTTFDGRALAVIRPIGTGEVVIKVSAEGLRDVSVSVSVKDA